MNSSFIISLTFFISRVIDEKQNPQTRTNIITLVSDQIHDIDLFFVETFINEREA